FTTFAIFLLSLQGKLDLDDDIRKHLPELPDKLKSRFIENYGLSAYDAGVLVAERETAFFFEAVAENDPGKAKMAANWVINELFGRLNKEGIEIDKSPVTALQLAKILMAIGAGTISTKTAKELFDIVWREGGNPDEIIEQRGMRQVSDVDTIQIAIDVLFQQHPDKVADAKANPKAVGWFVGQVMQRTKGKANPQTVNELLKRKLAG
ncbi:MAG: Asp-tRNA(Asn)/Glu-tRNA(Gln) amidotransferase GatCAB subunit B, partial [Deltaproteobacteria bacterium]|nr:Asp-tRNA(Asn)/Glu-tRNA(Gln) amidotransferase GatCAB subunit B [Deltaproteobacteria bacterium]